MKTGFVRLTVEVPEELHEAFRRKCFLASPRATMKERIVDFIARETGMKTPKDVDRRKLTREQRESLDRKAGR